MYIQRRVAIYSDDNKSTGGKAVVKRFSKSEVGSDQPLVLALMHSSHGQGA